MRYKKIRGHQKIWKEIKQWEQQNKELDREVIKHSRRKYIKVWVSPYCDYDLLNSEAPEPCGKTRKLLIDSLLNIYHSWSEKMENLGEPYYLKIWLYEPEITKSQVVCALGDFIGFYENSFHKPEIEKEIDLKNNYGRLGGRMEQLTWKYAPHEQVISVDDIGEPFEFDSYSDYQQHKKWVKRKIKEAYRVKEGADGQKYYFFKKGALWIGGS